jgi:hypothetical protein
MNGEVINTLYAAVLTEAAIPSSTLQSEAKNGCCNIEEESNAISNCFGRMTDKSILPMK